MRRFARTVAMAWPGLALAACHGATIADPVARGEGAPPSSTVSAERMNRTPDWARRRMFGKTSPEVALVNIDDGNRTRAWQLHGRKHLIVYWGRGDRRELAEAVTFMRVLQKAQADLRAAGVEVMFVHARFATGDHPAMDDLELRTFRDEHAQVEGGQPLPSLPMYRLVDASPPDQHALGTERALTVADELRKSPTIVELDEHGIVRWHSEGIQALPSWASAPDAVQYTIIEAVLFALKDL